MIAPCPVYAVVPACGSYDAIVGERDECVSVRQLGEPIPEAAGACWALLPTSTMPDMTIS